MTAESSVIKNQKISLSFQPQGVDVDAVFGETLLESANQIGVKIASACGGRGICKSCVIRYESDDVPPPSDQDLHFFSAAKLAKGWRRACQTVPQSQSRILVPKRANAQASRMFVAGNDIWVHPEPVVEAILVTLPLPTLTHCISDAQRLIDAVNEAKSGLCQSIDFKLLQTLPLQLRKENWSVEAVVRAGEIIAVLPQKSHMLGLAIDLGTTNLAILLVDLRTGTTVASVGIENPQNKFGADVIARISHAKGKPSVLEEIQTVTVNAINQAVAAMCEEHALTCSAIVDVVVAANTAMHHMLLGLSVDFLGIAPFVPVAREMADVKARELGINIAAGALIHVMDNIAGYVGGDHTAMLLGIRADLEKRTVIALDIGTNTEISLLHQGNILSLSSPSGPALEGGNITCGMRAADGAIERIQVKGDSVELKTIGDCSPIGICGSAVLDAVAEFYQAGAINFRGQIDKSSGFAQSGEDGTVLHLSEACPDIVFTQQDVRSVQLAKSAIRAGIDLLVEQAGLQVEDLDRIVIAGAFGVYIRLESAIAIGMLPDLPIDRFEQVGNAASIGAKLALVSGNLRQQAKMLAAKSVHSEQAGSKSFMTRFMRQIHLPT